MADEITTSQHILIPDRVLFRELDGESVLLNLDNDSYYGLDQIGTRMLQLLMSSKSIHEAHTVLLDEYEVEPERLQSDLLELIGELKKQGLITLVL